MKYKEIDITLPELQTMILLTKDLDILKWLTEQRDHVVNEINDEITYFGAPCLTLQELLVLSPTPELALTIEYEGEA